MAPSEEEAGTGQETDIFQGFSDPWGSAEEEAAQPQAAGTASSKALGVPAVGDGFEGAGGELEGRVRRTEQLVLLRWARAREQNDAFLAYSSMISCQPFPVGCEPTELPRGYSATWGLEVRCDSQGEWRVFACRSFHTGDVVERCPLLRLQRPDDDDVAICRFLSLEDPEIEWTKEFGDKMPELRAEKLEEMQLERSEVLRPNRIIRSGRRRYYPLGYGPLYADAASTNGAAPAAAELQVEDGQAREALVVALREVAEGEELTLRPGRPVKLPAQPYGAEDAAPAVDCAANADRQGPHRGAAPCSGCLVSGRSSIHGLGVFAAPGSAYGPGRVVELCPALLLDSPAAVHCMDFAMQFGGNCGMCSVLPLGCGPLYNHMATGKTVATGAKASTPLAWAYDEGLSLVAFRADVAIAAGTELVIDYGSEYWESRGIKPVGP